MSSGAELLQKVPKRLQDDRGQWLTKSQFRREGGNSNRKWNKALARWRAQCRSQDMVELQMLIAEREAALADMRAEVYLERQKLEKVQVNALRSAQLADQAEEMRQVALRRAEEVTQSLVQARGTIAVLTLDRDRAADGRRAARKDARGAEAMCRRAQQRADAAELRATGFERRLATAKHKCESIAAGAAYWKQRALSAEGQLRSARSKPAALEESHNTSLGAVSSPTLRTPPRGAWGSPTQPTLPSSPLRPASITEDKPGLDPGVVCPRVPPEAKEVPEHPTLICFAAPDALSGTETERSSGGSMCPIRVCTETVEKLACFLNRTLGGELLVQRISLLVQQAEHIGRECSRHAAAEELGLILRSFTRGREQLAKQAVVDREVAFVHREEALGREFCCTAAIQERAEALVRVSQLRAVHAERRLLPHAELAGRGGVEMLESAARWGLARSHRRPRIAPNADCRRVPLTVVPHGQPFEDEAQQSTNGGSHHDSGWFLTLGVISLSVAAFAPRRWAPVCRKAAVAVHCVHRHWLTAAGTEHQNMVARLGPSAGDVVEEERFGWAMREWQELIDEVSKDRPSNVRNSQRILLMHAKSALNHLQRLRLDLQHMAQHIKHMAHRIRATTAAMEQTLGSEDLMET
eukprot:TRINITY_DN8447_c0_g1_i1.p1 TRINITY_DN8447_c0_g1~~TRINITY_DN8447_c0_g1_i1.p1  ORF type:complete len:639 (+),score=120.85 TRINITY_DN8447_c0_g1_i1:79-1995(+)